MTTNKLERKVERLAAPLGEFATSQIAASGLLMICTLAALAIANSAWSDSYEHLLHLPVGLSFGDARFEASLRHWINDGLMALFFFLLGLEIKREVLAGELSDPRTALLVVLAALGGMLVPAGLYLLVAGGGDGARGWGIPVATDAAFAIGAMSFLAGRLPKGLFAFLAGFAIADDILAVLVIAVAYSGDIDLAMLGYGAGILAAMTLLNVVGVRVAWPYVLLGIALWAVILASGVHATLAGVLAAMTVPSRPRVPPERFSERIAELSEDLENGTGHDDGPGVLGDPEQHEIMEEVRSEAERATTPLQRWEHSVDRPVSLLILPLFALANAGISLSALEPQQVLGSAVSLAIIVALVAGKLCGIVAACWIGLRLGLARLPDGVRFRHIIGVGALAGMGFTLALFVAGLAFPDDAQLLQQAKAGILLGSLFAMLLGMGILATAGPGDDASTGDDD